MSDSNSAHGSSSAKVIDALSTALYEFILLTLPVALYVALEAYVKEDWSYFYSSPEWAIATIFLSVQAVFLYFKDLLRTGRRTNLRALGGLVFYTVIVVVVASINALESLRDHGVGSSLALSLRLSLFLISAIVFFMLVASGRYTYLNVRKE